mgnify:CR=1 FL=1
MLIDLQRYRAAALILAARGCERPGPPAAVAPVWWRRALHAEVARAEASPPPWRRVATF